PRSVACARLQVGLADVADPETARRAEGEDQAGVRTPPLPALGGESCRVGKGALAPCPPSLAAARERWARFALPTLPSAPSPTRGEGKYVHHCFSSVVSCAPSSATKIAISSAGSVLLALAETRCVEPGGSKKDWPTLNVSTGPPPSCERISPLVT